jgi:hypothetical protein
MTRTDHAPIPDSLEVIHDLIELLDVLFGESNVEGSDVFSETEDPGLVSPSQAIQVTY